MLKEIKKAILANYFLYFLAVNVYGILNGFLFAYRTRNKLIITDRTKKFVIPFYNRVYAFDIIREWNDYINSVEPDFVDKKGYFVYNFSKTRKHRVKDTDIVMYNNYLPEFLESDMVYMQSLKLSPGENIMDLGAYCGLTAYLFSKAVGNRGRILSVEPDILNYYVLQKNIRDHCLVNVRAINAAIWSKNMEIEFSQESAMGSAVTACTDRRGKTYNRPGITLIELARRFRFKRIDVVKMDIEGSEYPAFETIDEFIARYTPRFIIEVHYNKDGKIDLDYFYDIFTKHGYEMEIIKQSKKEIFPLIYAYK